MSIHYDASKQCLIRCSVPQSEETRAELSQIAWVPRQVNLYSLLMLLYSKFIQHPSFIQLTISWSFPGQPLRFWAQIKALDVASMSAIDLYTTTIKSFHSSFI